MAKAIFGRTLRLQIGCGAEPTLFKYNHDLIELGKKYGIQYISMTTNANLLTKESIINLLYSGLDELTISIHGITKSTYEDLMTKASFEKLMEVMQLLEIERKKYPTFKLRLNYTMNNQNIAELNRFFDVFGAYQIDFLQLRALRDIGGDIRSVEIGDTFNNELAQVLSLLKNQCKDKGVIFIPPTSFESDEQENESKEMKSFSYIYISPKMFFHPEFNWKNETFNQFSRRTHYTFELCKDLFLKKVI
jgi:MoaA/NifB/PqqE/SkfB family radical SAM enzyme